MYTKWRSFCNLKGEERFLPSPPYDVKPLKISNFRSIKAANYRQRIVAASWGHFRSEADETSELFSVFLTIICSIVISCYYRELVSNINSTLPREFGVSPQSQCRGIDLAVYTLKHHMSVWRGESTKNYTHYYASFLNFAPLIFIFETFNEVFYNFLILLIKF